jgi:hypothetical protein
MTSKSAGEAHNFAGEVEKIESAGRHRQICRFPEIAGGNAGRLRRETRIWSSKFWIPKLRFSHKCHQTIRVWWSGE